MFDSVDCSGLQIFTIWQLAHLPGLGNIAACFGVPHCADPAEYFEDAPHSVCRRAPAGSCAGLVWLSHADIQGFSLTLLWYLPAIVAREAMPLNF
jgi:hypothetical protein